MITIACIGIVVQDRIYNVKQLPNKSGKYPAISYMEVGGGPAANAAVAAARLGAKSYFIGRVGDDSCGESLINELESENVMTDYVKIIPNARTSQSAVLVDTTGERTIINAASPDYPAQADWLDAIDFEQFDVVLADVRWHEGALEGLSRAKERGIPTILDADVTNQDITPLIELADHVAFSKPGLAMSSQGETYLQQLQQINQQIAGIPYVTLGEKGCYWIEGEQSYRQESFNVDIVDTTGAGDVFHGALAFAIGMKYPLKKCVEFACATAALKCQKAGGRAGVPSLKQLQAFLLSYQ